MHHRVDTQYRLKQGKMVTPLGAQLHWLTIDPKVFPYGLLCLARAGYVMFFTLLADKVRKARRRSHGSYSWETSGGNKMSPQTQEVLNT